MARACMSSPLLTSITSKLNTITLQSMPGKQHLKQQTLSSLEEALDPGQFIRIHRSYIVNVERVTRIEPYTKDSRVLILQNGTKLPVSQSGYTRISKLMG